MCQYNNHNDINDYNHVVSSLRTMFNPICNKFIPIFRHRRNLFQYYTVHILHCITPSIVKSTPLTKP